MLTFKKSGISSFEFKGSGVGEAYTEIKTQEVDSSYFGLNSLEFLYSHLYSQLGICSPSSVTLSESEQVFYIDIRLPTPPENN